MLFSIVQRKGFESKLLSRPVRDHTGENRTGFIEKAIIVRRSYPYHQNLSKLINVGFKEVSKLNEFDCFIFHDVDLLIENDNAIYHCEETPMHYSGPCSFAY